MERSENSDRSESAEPILPRTHRDITTNQINHHHNNPPNSFPSSSRRPRWPTVDGSLGLSEEESTAYARRFFKLGFFFLPFLWAVNCFYFWPVLRHSHSFPLLRRCKFHRRTILFLLFITHVFRPAYAHKDCTQGLIFETHFQRAQLKSELAYVHLH